MLHGFTQSGDLFRAKTRALEKHLRKSFPLHDVSLVYPTGPLELKPDGIQDDEPASASASASVPASDESQKNRDDNNDKPPPDIEAFAWWRRSDTADPPIYLGLDTGLEAVSRVLTQQGPFDGVIGFSQGAACAAIVASLLEPNRRAAFDYFSDPGNANTTNMNMNSSSSSSTTTPIAGIPLPQSFDAIPHPPLKFAVCYSGFRAPGARYRAFYEQPQIRTPVMHVVGSLDAIVDEGRTRALINACEGDPEADGRVLRHPGGHFLPSQRVYLDGVVSFMRGALDNAEALSDSRTANDAERKSDRGRGGVGDVRAEDMDMPF